ncbi:MAG: WYL domain-containing protein [Planctomycetota bacterium]
MDKFYQGMHHRIVELDSWLRAGKYPNCTTFSKHWDYSPKTVQRDIHYLKYSLGAPIEYDFKNKGYFYTDTSWQLTGLDLTEGELFLMLIAQQMAEQFKGTPLAKNLESIFKKIRASLPDKISVDPAYLGTQLVSFHGHPTREISQKIWISTFKALRANKFIQIVYHKPGSADLENREVEPLHLSCLDGEWYLIAYCRMRKEIRHFAVSRIQSVKQYKSNCEPREFNTTEYFKNLFSRFVGEKGKEYKIVVRFSPEAAKWVRECIWHSKQTIKENRNGSIVLSFPAPELCEVQRWVLGWGSAAEVLSPAELRKSVKEEIKWLSKAYKS